jgi:hypothetical protein
VKSDLHFDTLKQVYRCLEVYNTDSFCIFDPVSEGFLEFSFSNNPRMQKNGFHDRIDDTSKHLFVYTKYNFKMVAKASPVKKNQPQYERTFFFKLLPKKFNSPDNCTMVVSIEKKST